MRFAYYSLAFRADSACVRQWSESIHSLRRHSPRLPVYLFLYDAPSELDEEARRFDVTPVHLGGYRDTLHAHHVHGGHIAHYPFFHKFLSLRGVPADDASQILFLDCDTFFTGPVERLFDRYREHDLYAREEPHSAASGGAPVLEHLDEPALAHTARLLGVRPVLPFNTGVLLLNHGIWRELDRLFVSFLDVAFRLMCGLASQGVLAHEPERAAALHGAMSPVDRARALPYPSRNDWIVEEVAMWLTLGYLPRFSQGLLSRADVAQGGEFHAWRRAAEPPVVTHYFGSHEDEFFAGERG